MSKSVGNVINPMESSKILTEEGLRYFLLKQDAINDDANFSLKNAVYAVNSDLVNNLSNLLSRSTNSRLNPSQRYPSPSAFPHSIQAQNLIQSLNEIRSKVTPFYDDLLFYKAIEVILAVGKESNAFFQLCQPWKLQQGEELENVLYLTYEVIRVISILLQPIVPKLSDNALSRLGVEKEKRMLELAQYGKGLIEGNSFSTNNEIYLSRIKID